MRDWSLVAMQVSKPGSVTYIQFHATGHMLHIDICICVCVYMAYAYNYIIELEYTFIYLHVIIHR